MANGDCGTVAARQLDGTIKLTANIGFVLRVIQEDFAFDDFHTGP
ncbi:hypothetical protein SDC9_208035 [bioreactor metagenome]|uniref:Uncharacterized protein n=1 Tax=bioreactor metagenome TaxID=1076179 RepID=A0A645JA85_9ZZZZ